MSQPPVDLVSEIETRTRAASLISLFVDFDGTLVPITGDPAAPRLDPGTGATLQLLSSYEHLVTTIISGRAIEDLYTRIRLPGLIYAGNHGLEIFGRQFRFVEPTASARRQALERLSEELALEIRAYPGAIVECKGLTAAVHYRMAAEADWPRIQQIVYTAMARNGALFHVNPGRKLFDIVPRTNWHKGTAVQWINSHLGVEEVLTVYLGDDVTDEDAFAVLPDAVTIKVGPGPLTSARYRLPGPAAVHEFLFWLAHALRDRHLIPHKGADARLRLA
jgi:trehalose 6-phosphate phosphatase